MTTPVPKPLAAVLAGRTPAGVLTWPAGRAAAEAVELARDAGWRATLLDLRRVADKPAFMDACARALHLPSWFGRNWDALADCLRDLSWCPTEAGRLLAVRGWQDYAKAEPGEWALWEGVLVEAVAYWRDTPTGLAVVLARE
ncbi:barstar family protein [Streptomyces sp. NPDC059740]|uniref:barstar family protein n=1 Tax=Streptomyces sp. NPDC059740 TaxID=3346926 RepID=UPI00366A4DA3